MMAKLHFTKQCKKTKNRLLKRYQALTLLSMQINHDAATLLFIRAVRAHITRDSYVTIIEELSAAGANTNTVN